MEKRGTTRVLGDSDGLRVGQFVVAIGDTVHLSILREGKEMSIDVTLGEAPQV
jgi:S1-C subfamily serine protease